MFFHRVPLFEEDSLWIQSFLTLLAVRDTSRETLDKTSVTAGRVERHLYCLVCVPSKKIMEGVIYNFDRGLPYPGLGKGIADNRCITEPNTARDGALWKIESEGFTFCQHPCKIRPKDPNFVTFFEEKIQIPLFKKPMGGGGTPRAVNSPHLQILRIDREGIIDDVIMHETWQHLCKKAYKKMLLELYHLYLIGLLPTNHIIAYITMAYRGFWGKVRC